MKRSRLILAVSAVCISVACASAARAGAAPAPGETPDPASPAQPAAPAPPLSPSAPPPDPALEPGLPAAGSPQPVPPSAAGSAAPLQRDANPLLRLFDVNGDGVLTADEVANSAARLRELDRNLDGILTPDELLLVLAPRWDERRRAVPGVLPAEPSIAPQVPAAPAAPAAPLPTAGDAAGRSTEKPRVEIYPLRSLDPNQTLARFQQLLRDRQDARLTIDIRTRSLLVYGPGDVHAMIRKELADLAQSGLPEQFGQAPGMESQPPLGGFPIAPPPRVIPVYNARARDILRTVRQVYRDRLFEPRTAPAADAAAAFGAAPLPPEAAGLPPDRMVVGLGADPNSVVVTADDELFFEVLDLIERLDSGIPAEPGPPEDR
jgi:hypothetical protein